MASMSYEEKNKKYRKDVQKNFAYLAGEIPLKIILPHLQEILHPSDYEMLRRRVQNNSDWDCNQELLSCLQKREYWWRAFREALVSINRYDVIQRLGWDENTFDFGPRPRPRPSDENSTVGQNSGAVFNPPENPEKPNKKQQTVEEFTLQKLNVYKKQNDLAKGSYPTRDENNQSEQREGNPNLLSEQYEQKKTNTDFKVPVVLSDENDLGLGKVLESEIHPAVRRNLPLNFQNSDQEEKLSNYDASARPERTARDEINANCSPTSNSPQSMDKISNSQSQNVNIPPKLDHRSISAPTICTEPGAAVVFPPNYSPVRQTEIPAPIQNVPMSPIHHSVSAPSMNQAPIPRQQQHADVEQEVWRTKNEDDSYFEPSINSAEQPTITTSGTGANFEPRDSRFNAQREEIDLREQNLELCDTLKEENGSNPNPGSSGSQNFKDLDNDGPTSATAFQEIPPQTSDSQSNMAFMTTNDDVIKPSIASTVDPKGVSKSNNVRGGEQIIRHKSLNLNREQDSYVTGLHSYGSDVTSSIPSGAQSSTFVNVSQDYDQTNAKTLDSVIRVDALDNWSFNCGDLDSSSIGSPDAIRFVSGSAPSVPSVADDDLTARSDMEDLQHNNSSSAQNVSEMQDSASVENSASAQNPAGTMPKFDSLLSGTGSQQSLLSNANQNVALSDLPLAQARNNNVPEFSELLSVDSSVDPADYSRRTDDSEPGTFSPVSVDLPPSSSQLAGLNRVPLNENQDHDDAANDADEPPPSFFRRIFNSIGNSFESVIEAVIPSADCSQ